MPAFRTALIATIIAVLVSVGSVYWLNPRSAPAKPIRPPPMTASSPQARCVAATCRIPPA